MRGQPRLSSLALAAATILGAGHAMAAGIDCRAARSQGERTICADPVLRAADAKLSRDYAIVRRAAQPKALAASLVASQRAWLVMRDRDCAAADCLKARIDRRDAVLAALAARVSADNPSLLDLTAVWISGSYTAGEVTPAGRSPSAHLPQTGQVVTFEPHEICIAASCATIGLEPTTLAAVSQVLPTRLALPPESPAYTAFVGGKAAYTLVPAPDGDLIAVTDGCDAKGEACTVLNQRWRSARAHGIVHVQSALTPDKP